MDELKPGCIIGGYSLDAEVARGGMGTIFRARHSELESVVAVKVLKRDLALRPDIIKRFLREGKLIATLDHPGIIKVYDVGRQGEFYYLVMEFIHGRDLQHLVDDDGPVHYRKVLDIGRQVADTLEYAHNAGVVHRDIKPSNLILANNGRVYVTDFGIARLLEQETALTKTGALIGTPTHMSPEQCRGSCVDGRSDLYSLGATLYTLLAGRPPFSSKSPARLISQLLHENPPPIESIATDLPPAVATLVKRMMAKHPAARFQTGREVCQAIENVDTTMPTPTPTPASIELPREPRPLAAGLLAAACALMVIVATVVMWVKVKDSLAATGGPPVAKAGPRGAGPSRSRPPRGGDGDRTGTTAPTPHGDSPGDEPEDDPPLDLRALESRLRERIVEFQKALLAGDIRRAYGFVDPGIRNDPNLLLSLGRLSQSVESLGSEATYEHTLTMDERKADVIFVFRKGDYVLHFPGTWTRRRGVWFLQPQETLRVK